MAWIWVEFYEGGGHGFITDLFKAYHCGGGVWLAVSRGMISSAVCCSQNEASFLEIERKNEQLWSIKIMQDETNLYKWFPKEIVWTKFESEQVPSGTLL